MTTDDDRISKRYRELRREEPSRHVDEAILAAARRAVHTRPAPLVVPSGRQRWYFPLAAAAIIVLAVAVTVHMEREQPNEEMVSSNSTTAPAAAKEAEPSTPAQETAAASSPRRNEMRDEARAQKSRPAPEVAEKLEQDKPAEPPRLDIQAPPPPVPPAELQKRAEAAAQDSLGSVAQGRIAERTSPAAAASAPQAASAPLLRRAEEGARKAPMLSAAAAQSPEQWLQGIADLRSQGYHEEADQQLAEFRKRYADYRIPEALLRKVERPR